MDFRENGFYPLDPSHSKGPATYSHRMRCSDGNLQQQVGSDMHQAKFKKDVSSIAGAYTIQKSTGHLKNQWAAKNTW